MIVVCEPQCAGFVHAQVNAALLAVIRAAFPGQRIMFLAEGEHLAEVGETLREHAIAPIELLQIRLPRQRGHLIRFCQELALCKAAFAAAARNQARWVVYSSITSESLFAVKLVLPSFPQIRCVAAMHAILATITQRPRRVLRRVFWFRRALRFRPSDRIAYLVMGQPIADELCREMPAIADQVMFMDLPYFYAAPQPHEPFAGDVVRFGAFGVGHRDKGTDALFRMASEMQALDCDRRPEFTVLGPIVDWRMQRMAAHPVVVPSPAKPLRRAEFDRRAAGVDYAVFFHRPQSYALRASGVFCDALSHLKPVIALRTPFFAHHFEAMGDIGYLCDSYKEMQEVILDILRTKPVARYARQRANLLAARERVSLSRLSARLAELLR
ncbi:MAG TPA: hypothetical protein VM221_07240 [Armatimonadota bacterium]|nr:hypothetical protein [Armatimonadota bacterium]